jgi:hypothetical protein
MNRRLFIRSLAIGSLAPALPLDLLAGPLTHKIPALGLMREIKFNSSWISIGEHFIDEGFCGSEIDCRYSNSSSWTSYLEQSSFLIVRKFKKSKYHKIIKDREFNLWPGRVFVELSSFGTAKIIYTHLTNE